MKAPCVVLSLALAACSSTPHPSVQPPRPDSVINRVISKGVKYEYRWYASGPLAIHSIVVDPHVCEVGIRSIKAQDALLSRETPEAIARRAHDALGLDVVAAINADFFSYTPPGVPEGPQISNGVLLKSEGWHREAIEDRVVRLQPVFAFTADRKKYLVNTRFQGELQSKRATATLSGVNVSAPANGTVILTPFYGDSTTGDSASTHFIFRALNTARNGVLLRVDSVGATAIPRDGFVIATRGSSATSQLQIGDTVSYRTSFTGLPGNVTELVGGYPMLLLHGRAVHHDEAGLRPTFSDRQHPRSAIGWGRDGLVRIYAVDGRAPGHSTGMSLQELSDYLITQGVTDALNLDGGGSTTLVAGGRILNRPSDASQRPVANALVVYSRQPCR